MLNVEPHHDETLSSWIERTAIRNGMRLGSFLDWMDEPLEWHTLDTYPSRRLLSKICHRTSRTAEALRSLLAPRKLSTLPRELAYAYCPCCWDEDIQNGQAPYGRREWMHAWTVHCSKHRCLLVDYFCDRSALQWECAWRRDPRWAIAAKVGYRPSDQAHLVRALAQSRAGNGTAGVEVEWLEWLQNLRPWLETSDRAGGLRRSIRDLVLIAGLRFAQCSLASLLSPGNNRQPNFYVRKTPRDEITSMTATDMEQYRSFIAAFSARRQALLVTARVCNLLGLHNLDFADREIVRQQLCSLDERLFDWVSPRLSHWPPLVRSAWLKLVADRQCKGRRGWCGSREDLPVLQQL